VFQLGAGAFDVLRQQFVTEGFADVLGPQRPGRVVEGGEDAGVVRMLGQGRCDGREPVGKAGDGLAGDREMLQVRLGLPQPGLQVVDLCAEVVGQGPGGVFLEVQGVEQGLDAHAAPTCVSRQVGAFARVRRRIMTWVIAQ
jgi:hypothetical protein